MSNDSLAVSIPSFNITAKKILGVHFLYFLKYTKQAAQDHFISSSTSMAVSLQCNIKFITNQTAKKVTVAAINRKADTEQQMKQKII